MKRLELVGKLKRVEPALSSKDFIPIFSCFCFDGETITAYDDIVAIQVPCDSPIHGGVRGQLLLNFLQASAAKDLEFEAEEKELLVKAGRAKLRAPILPEEDFIFSFPKKGGTSLPVDDAFIEAFKRCLVSMGQDPSHPFRMGVTIEFGHDDDVTFYSSNSLTVSRSYLPWGEMSDDGKVPEALVGKSVVIPPRFCELFPAMAAKDSDVKLIVSSDWIEARFGAGVRLFSKTISGAEPEQFQAIIDSLLTEEVHTGFIPVPKGFDRCLDRALVVLAQSRDKFTSFMANSERIMMRTESRLGIVRDTLKVEGHPEVTVACPPELIKAALPFTDEFFITESSFVMRGTGFVHLVSIVEGE